MMDTHKAMTMAVKIYLILKITQRTIGHVTALSISEVVYSLSKISVSFQFLQLRIMPYRASIYYHYPPLQAQRGTDLAQQAVSIQRAIGCTNIGSMVGASASPSLLPLPMP